MELKITPSGQTIVKPTALGPGANTDTKLLIYGLFKRAEFWHRTGLAAQRVEARIGCKILNTMTALGMPDSEMIG